MQLTGTHPVSDSLSRVRSYTGKMAWALQYELRLFFHIFFWVRRIFCSDQKLQNALKGKSGIWFFTAPVCHKPGHTLFRLSGCRFRELSKTVLSRDLISLLCNYRIVYCAELIWDVTAIYLPSVV